MHDPHPQPLRRGVSPASYVADPQYEASESRQGYPSVAHQNPSLPTILDILRRRWYLPLFCVLLCGAFAWLYASRQTPIYSATSILLVTPPARLTTQSNMSIFDEMATRGSSLQRPLETQIAVLKRPFILEQALQRLGLPPDEALRSKVSVRQMEETNLVSVAVEHPSPTTARRVADAVSEVFLGRTRAVNQKSVSGARRFLELQMAEKKRLLEERERQLEQAKQNMDAPSITSQIQAQAAALSALEAQLSETRTERMATIATIRSLTRQLDSVRPMIEGGFTTAVNPIAEQMKGELQTLETERSALLKEYQSDQPEITTLDTRINSIRNRLRNELQKTIVSARETSPNPLHGKIIGSLAEAETTALALASREASLTDTIDSMRQDVNRLPTKERVLNTLTRDVASLSTLYNQFEEKYQALRVEEEAKLADGELLERAREPDTPVRPRKNQILMSGMMAGLLFSLMLIVVLESLDNTLRDPRQIEDVLGVPVLTGVPRIRSLDPTQASANMEQLPGDRYASGARMDEGARILQAAITYNNPDHPIQSVLVSSPLPGEGKTTLSEHLAKVTAESGKQVVLVDMDYLRPGLTRRYPGKYGLTNVVVGQISLEEATIKTDVPNLAILTTGPLPSNPAAFMQSERFNAAIEQLKNRYDLVIFDAPPMVVSDALIATRYSDGVVLVVVPGSTTKAAIDRSVDLLRRVGANLIGVCLNKITRSNTTSYYGDYSYYGASYGYRYGSDGGSKKKQGLPAPRESENGSKAS